VFAEKPPAASPGDLRPFEYAVFAAVATAFLLVAGGVLAYWRFARSFGQGVLVGVSIGLIGSGAGCSVITYL
jgi:hypothetical protein